MDQGSREWEIFVDALCGTFSQKSQLSVEDLFQIVQKLWSGSSKDVWSKIDDFVQNGYLRRLYRRLWRGSVYVACPPKLVIAGSCGRLIGLFPSGKRRQLLAFCSANELDCAQTYDFKTDTYGAITSLVFGTGYIGAIYLAGPI